MRTPGRDRQIAAALYDHRVLTARKVYRLRAIKTSPRTGRAPRLGARRPDLRGLAQRRRTLRVVRLRAG